MEEALRRHIVEGGNGDYVEIMVYVKPEAPFTGFKLELGELVFYTEEPNLHGRVNASLIQHLSRLLRVSPSQIDIVYGVRESLKRVRVKGVNADRVMEALIKALRETEEKAI